MEYANQTIGERAQGLVMIRAVGFARVVVASGAG
jgi:hypothetical protein